MNEKHRLKNTCLCPFPFFGKGNFYALRASGNSMVDLRHSCASFMLANGVPMKQIQEWLGHSDFSTTANIYAHLDYSSKLTSADAMLSGLGIAEAK